MNCDAFLGLEHAPKPPWPTGFEKSKIHQPNLEKLQFEGSKIEAFLLDFQHFSSKISKNAYFISVGTDLLRPIDGVLKNKLNYEFDI